MEKKRGRKRSGYFYEEQEEAVKTFNLSTNQSERDKIFNNILHPAFTKMIESIIRRYKLYVPDEEFNETFDDTMSFLMSKIQKYREKVFKYDEIESNKDGISFVKKDENFYLANYKDTLENNPDYIVVTFSQDTIDKYNDAFKKSSSTSLTRYYKKTEYNYKAYSYCGTICKNYLFYKLNQYKKHQDKQESYDDLSEAIKEDDRYSDTSFGEESKELFLNNLIEGICQKIQEIINNKEIQLSKDEVNVGLAIIDLFNNWEEAFEQMGSNKMNKSMILMYIKDATRLDTASIRKNMKKYKAAYVDLKKVLIEM